MLTIDPAVTEWLRQAEQAGLFEASVLLSTPCPRCGASGLRATSYPAAKGARWVGPIRYQPFDVIAVCDGGHDPLETSGRFTVVRR